VLGLLLFLGLSERTSQSGPRSDVPARLINALGIETPDKAIAAPNFTLEDLDGKKVSLEQLRGRVVFLNFWATWCVPCRAEMPAMEKLHREFNDKGLAVIAVNLRENSERVREFFDEMDLTFTVLLDGDGTVSEEYGVWSLPLSYFVNREGVFAGKSIGMREWDGPEGKAFFRSLLAGR
jgi:peroxiredoxin